MLMILLFEARGGGWNRSTKMQELSDYTSSQGDEAMPIVGSGFLCRLYSVGRQVGMRDVVFRVPEHVSACIRRQRGCDVFPVGEFGATWLSLVFSGVGSGQVRTNSRLLPTLTVRASISGAFRGDDQRRNPIPDFA